MRALIKLTPVAVLSAALLFLGCGDTTRNAQGVSFTFLGWFSDASGSQAASAISIGISDVNPEEPSSPIVGGDGSLGGMVLSFAGLQNNLVGESIRVERIIHEYKVPGATLQVPGTSVGCPFLLAPFDPSDEGAADSTLPEGQRTGVNTVYCQVPIVTPDVRTFINLHRHHFPELPFVMVVKSYATGVSSSGKRRDTNSVEIEIFFTPDITVPPSGRGDNFAEDNVVDAEAAEYDEF